jgi:hypothetical protein
MKEEAIHRAVVQWLRWQKPAALWFHCPNGEARSKATAGRLKAMGTLPGVPDLLFVTEGGTVKFIELKAEGSYLRPPQKAFKQTVEALGCDYAVCRSLESVQEALAEWGLLHATARQRPPQAALRAVQ